jgi:predicted DNA-binding protein (UPF0251 family)
MSVATEVNLGRYEGLVFRTSTMYEGRLGMEREDLQQILRLCVVAYLYLGYRQTEIATMMSCPRREIERRVRSIRRKMADWRPSLTMGNGEVVELEAQVKRGIRRVAA